MPLPWQAARVWLMHCIARYGFASRQSKPDICWDIIVVYFQVRIHWSNVNIVLLTVHHYIIVANYTHACTVCKYIQNLSLFFCLFICSFLFNMFFTQASYWLRLLNPQCFDVSTHCAVLQDVFVFSKSAPLCWEIFNQVSRYNLSHKLIASCVR